MRVLLDTCVISELRRPNCHDKVRKAIEKIGENNLYTSVIVIGELVKGVKLLSDNQRREELQNWILELEGYYNDRILPIDLETTRIWGEFTALAKKNGKVLSITDGLIAATAFRHGLHVMTRNVSDFEITDAMLLNPWD